MMDIMSQDQSIPIPPPQGDASKADKYLQKLTQLIKQDKVTVGHTDLQKFDLNSIQDHYRIDLQEYEVEISHSKQPDTGKDFYIMLFNNLKVVQENDESCTNKVILAYIHLTQNQFNQFKSVALQALEKKRIEEDNKRFIEAMKPVDNLLNSLEGKTNGQKFNRDQRPKQETETFKETPEEDSSTSVFNKPPLQQQTPQYPLQQPTNTQPSPQFNPSPSPNPQQNY